MFQVNRRLIVVQTLIISPPLGLGDLLFPVRPSVCLSVANLRKMTIYNTNIDLVNDNVLKNLVSISLFVLKVLNKK